MNTYLKLEICIVCREFLALKIGFSKDLFCFKLFEIQIFQKKSDAKIYILLFLKMVRRKSSKNTSDKL